MRNRANAQTMKFSILLLLTLGFNACPALVQEGKDHNERAVSAPITGPLRQSRNPNYFEDARGTPLILCGSQTWNTLQDWGSKGAVQPLDFEAFVSFLKAHGHNFTLLWCTELPKFRGLPTTESSPPDFTVSPFPCRVFPSPSSASFWRVRGRWSSGFSKSACR